LKYHNPSYGLITNPSNDILCEINKAHQFGFDFVELAIEGPEGNPKIIDKNKSEIIKILRKFNQKTIAHTAYWIDLCSDYEYVRQGWILEIMREIRTARKIGIDLIKVHANLNGMFYGNKRQTLLDNMIKSLREVIRYAERSNARIMLENVPISNGIHNVYEFKYIIDNVNSLLVHLDIPHAFTSGGMKSVLDYISIFKDRIVHIHWHDNHGMKDEHLAIGEGLVDHRKAVKALKDINYDGTITLEVFSSIDDAKLSADKLRTMFLNNDMS
jgi:sugar phosphate isomerase/epimerase